MNIKSLRPLRPLALVAASLLGAQIAWAHTYGAPVADFAHGAAHPLGGLDHVLAMLAVGLWAAQRGGRELWLLPLSFMGVMVIGGWLGAQGVFLPAVESGIAASVAVLGLMIAMAVRLPALPTAVLVGLFALFHGHAHGTELAAGASAVSYAAGFVLATGILHLSGIALGVGANRLMTLRPALHASIYRIGGGAIALVGTALFAAAL